MYDACATSEESVRQQFLRTYSPNPRQKVLHMGESTGKIIYIKELS